MAVGYRQIPSRLDGIPFYFQRITRSQHVFFPNPPRDINGFRNNNQVYWQLPPDQITFNAENNYRYDLTVFDTDSAGSIQLQTPFIITGEGTIRFSGNTVKIVLRHKWTHRFLDADGNILRDLTPNNNPITISNATPTVIDIPHTGEVEYSLSNLSREIEIYLYQLPSTLLPKLQDIGLALTDLRIGIMMELEIRTYPTNVSLRPVRSFGRVTDYTDTNRTPRDDETLMNLIYSNPVISFRQGVQGSGERLGILTADPDNLFPPDGVTREQFLASTMGQLLRPAVRAQAGGRSSILLEEERFSIPQVSNPITFTMPANLEAQEYSFFPAGDATGFAHAVLNKGIEIDERGTYTFDLVTSIQFTSANIVDVDASLQLEIVLIQMRTNASNENIIVREWPEETLLRQVRGDEWHPRISVPDVICERGDWFFFKLIYESVSVGDNLIWRSQSLNRVNTMIPKADRRLIVTRKQI